MGCMRASSVSVPRRNRLLQRVCSRPGDLRVLGREHARHADAADDLAVDHDGDAALERSHAVYLQDAKPSAATGDDVLEGLAGTSEIDRGRGLALGDLVCRLLLEKKTQ